VSNSLLERILRSPLARQIEAEDAAQAANERAELVAELAKIEVERSVTVPPLTAAKTAAIERDEEVAALRVQTQQHRDAATHAEFVANLGLDQRRDRAHSRLRQLAPDSIEALVDELRDLDQEVCRTPITPEATEGRSRYDGGHERAFEAMQRAKQARATYLGTIRAQRAAAEALALTDLDGDDLRLALAEIRMVVREAEDVG
jgi:hypothetical protein